MSATTTRRRLSVFTVLATLAAVLTTTASGVASANLPNGCPDASTAGNAQREVSGFPFPDGHTHSRALLVFWIHSSSVTFDRAFGREFINSSSLPQTVSYEASTSETHSLTQSVSTGASTTIVKDVFSVTVNASVAESFSTSTGIKTAGSTTIPPFRRLLAEYGLKLLTVNWTIDIYQKDSRCWYHGSYRNVVSTVPTNIEAWQFTDGPA